VTRTGRETVEVPARGMLDESDAITARRHAEIFAEGERTRVVQLTTKWELDP
jgi:hypothetical protein